VRFMPSHAPGSITPTMYAVRRLDSRLGDAPNRPNLISEDLALSCADSPIIGVLLEVVQLLPLSNFAEVDF
jgi:hypothetical protein